MDLLERTVAKARGRFEPPPQRIPLSNWIEANVVLPPEVTAQPGPVRLWKFQRAIADAISDPAYERVTVRKCVRVGYSTLLTGALASFVANEPALLMLLLPTDDDCRDYVVSDMEPVFDATPAVSGLLSTEADETGRNTMRHRRFPGGSLKVVAGRSPRNLRRHNVRILMIDEEDAFEVNSDGDAIDQAVKRTLSFPNRKIIRGSTPVDMETSTICREYEASNQQVFEIKCVECGELSEPRWDQIQWEKVKDAQGRVIEHLTDTAKWACPKCGCLVEERFKLQMVEDGDYRALRPEVEGHAGFALNVLISPHVNARWSQLAKEFIQVKDDPDRLRVFRNTLLGEGWAELVDTSDPAELQTRAAPIGLNVVDDHGTELKIPVEVLVITVGVDVQDDRLEAVVIGWDRLGTAFVLGHFVIYGTPAADTTWRELDELLLTKWAHPLGAQIGIDAVAVDSGDGGWVDQVYAFCWARAHRHVMAIKGRWGHRPAIEVSKGQVAKGRLAGKNRLWIVGSDTIKSAVYQRLARYPDTVRFSKTLPPVWFEQLTAEHRVIRRVGGRPVARYERYVGRDAEALDCTVYAFAARQAITALNFDLRQAALSGRKPPPVPPPTRRVVRSSYMG